jgi:hypothetical protein
MHKAPMSPPEREALGWLFLGVMIATPEHEWPEGVPSGYFNGNGNLAAAVMGGDPKEIAAALRAKITPLAHVDSTVIDDPQGSVIQAVRDDVLMCRIDELAKRCERRTDGAFNDDGLRELNKAIATYLERKKTK